MRSHHGLAVAVSLAALAAWTAPAGAIEDRAFRIAMTAAAKATCADTAGPALARVALGDVLVQQADLEGYDPDAREIVLSRRATLTLVTNAAALDAEPDDPDPVGPLPSANGRGFVVLIGGERQVGGLIVTRLEELRESDACPVLLMGPVIDARLHLVLGRPRSRDELQGELWKVFMEKGPAAALAPALPTKVDALLSTLFPQK